MTSLILQVDYARVSNMLLFWHAQLCYRVRQNIFSYTTMEYILLLLYFIFFKGLCDSVFTNQVGHPCASALDRMLHSFFLRYDVTVLNLNNIE